MDVEIFTWSPRTGPTGSERWRVLKTQFGDGYTQLVADGLHTERQTWPLSFTGEESYIKAIRDFLRRHKGSKPFTWTPPMSDPALFRCEEVDLTPHGDGIYTLTATFEQHFHP